MIKVPVALGMIFCKSFLVDPTAAQTSLQGLLSSMAFQRFPTAAVKMSIFAYLTDGAGEGELRLEFLHLFAKEQPQWIWRQRRWIKFPRQSAVAGARG